MCSLQRHSINLAFLAYTCVCGAEEVRREEAVVIARAYVPNSLIPQGEVRLLRNGGETTVQTVLHTHFAKRVRNSIISKERKNWGEHQEAKIYVESLHEVFSEYRKRRITGKKNVALVISFIYGPGVARVDFSFPTSSRSKQGFHIQSATIWRSVSFSDDYIRRNQAHIVDDVFKKRAESLLNRLREDRTAHQEIDDD